MRNTIQAASNDVQSPIKVVWDEWNPMGDRDGTEFTLEMALWVALILQSFIRDSAFVAAANYTFFIGGNGPIQPASHGTILRHAEYYALKLYGDLLGSQLLSCRAEVPVQDVQMPMDRRWPQAKPASIPFTGNSAHRCGCHGFRGTMHRFLHQPG